MLLGQQVPFLEFENAFFCFGNCHRTKFTFKYLLIFYLLFIYRYVALFDTQLLSLPSSLPAFLRVSNSIENQRQEKRKERL